ncbi:MAG: ZIP family metal transporter [Clostridia bacterium]|nr:ZIP family metal transporter [Clostridia bacterium]
MKYLLLTAIGVGGSTIIGALIGFLFKKPSHKLGDYITSFAAGVMLCAAIVGLILPSMEQGTDLWTIIITTVGIFLGAYALNLIDKIIPHLHKVTGVSENLSSEKSSGLDKILLFVIAIGIHNLPEGIAAGVSFGGEISRAITVSGGIALQNIPEGMVIIAPLIAAGVSKRRTFLIALATGLIEVVGTFMGYFAISISTAILPFALAFAGGTMLYVISDEMIPETHSHGNERGATYSLLAGFVLMLIFDFIMR